MTDYEEKWRAACADVAYYSEQCERLRGSKFENPTLRDQFAMAALTGMMAANWDRDRVAKISYEVADYMLKVRDTK